MSKLADNSGPIGRGLQDKVGDLLGLLALPAMWTGREPAQVLGILLDVLVRVLDLEFAYARFPVPASSVPIEIARHASEGNSHPETSELGRALQAMITGSAPGATLALPDPAGRGRVSAAHYWLGAEPKEGAVVVGSRRPDFPSPLETVSLRLALSQAVVQLQAVQLAEERRRAERLDGLTLEDLEREHILRALERSRWVISGPGGAAVKLGMKRTSLQYRMAKLNIVRPRC